MEPFDLRLWPFLACAGGDASAPAIVDQIVIDSRRVDSPHAMFVALQGTQDGHQFVVHAAHAGCRFALVKKEWPAPADLPSHIQLLRVPDPLTAFQQIAGIYRHQLNISIISIVGSYGKTMVKDLLLQMLASEYEVAASPESFNSQIGVPLSLLTLKKRQSIAIIEAAFSKPGEMDALLPLIHPQHAILTHVGKKHLATMGTMEAIASECAKVLKACDEGGWVLFPSDPLLHSHLSSIDAKKLCWSTAASQLPHAQFLLPRHAKTMAFKIAYPCGGIYQGTTRSGFYYFLDLINMATKAAWLMGITAAQINQTLDQYTPQPTRTEIWKSPAGTTFINDAYCSDPQSVDAALRYFDLASTGSRKIFIFDGMRCSQDQEALYYRRIAKALKQRPVNKLILAGERCYGSLIDELRGTNTEICQYESLAIACEDLKPLLGSDDTVLIKGAAKQHLDLIAQAFNDSITNNQCIINLSAIKSNIAAIRNKLPYQTRLMVMVKALAYGTDDLRMARFLATCGIDILGVSYVEEGVGLKRAGIETAIFVINAGLYEAEKVVKWDLEVGVSEISLIQKLEEAAKKLQKTVKVHLHINTGMSRFGCRPEEAPLLAQYIHQSPCLVLEGLLTHFASSEDPAEDDFTQKQAALFMETIHTLSSMGITPRWKHAANSSGVLRFNFKHFNMARIGLAVYGLHASESARNQMDLQLAFSLQSRIVGINVCKKGETVSYGRSYKIQMEEQRIAVLPIGYFDGLHRNYSGKGHVIIRGQKAPMVGRITMDYMMVDVSNIPNAAIGDPVLLFGEDEYGHHVAPEDFALKVDSIPHELITCLGPRIQRVFVYEESDERRSCTGVKDEGLSPAT